MRKRLTSCCLIALLGLSAVACSRSCGKSPSSEPRLVKDTDGRKRYLVQKGEFKAYYDAWGRLQRIEQDEDGDGYRDKVSHHGAGSKIPYLIEIDTDHDRRFDRWEYYDRATGAMIKIGSSRHGWAPDIWIYPDSDGRPIKREYDEDKDNRVDRIELLQDGRLVRTEIDADRDGRFDRWESWSPSGVMTYEELDTNGDGRPDHRIRFTADGKVAAVERIKNR
jgi:hypothetical protein